MGIIYDEHVPEKELYAAYGLTAYGKINRYIWTIHNGKEEGCIITLRIADGNGNNLIDLHMGNRCIFMDIFNSTIDNLFYWITAENPEPEQIEKQVFRSLCQSDCLFNHRITSRKFKDQQEAESRKKIEEREAKSAAALDKIRAYCRKNGYIFYYDGWECFLLKALNKSAETLLKDNLTEHDTMKSYIRFAQEYPENKDLRIIQSGEISEINIEH